MTTVSTLHRNSSYCICNHIFVTDQFTACTNFEIFDTMAPKGFKNFKKAENDRKRKRDQRERDKIEIEKEVEKYVEDSSCCSEEEKKKVVIDFEKECKDIKLRHCRSCHLHQGHPCGD